MPPEREAEVFTLDSAGKPTGRLWHREGRLVLVPDDARREMVNPRSTRLYQLGLYSFTLRGTAHYEAAVKAGDFRPGEPVRLVREHDNKYDSNAVAVYAAKARKRAGYVNKQNARRLAKRIDAGEVFEAISMRGDGRGRWEEPVTVLIARADVIAHLLR